MPNKKVFVDDTPIAEKVEVVEEPKAKPKRKRKPLSEEQKKALVERLALARAAKKNARAGNEPAKETKPKATRKKKSPVKKEAPAENNKYREHQLELQNLRSQMELQKMKFEIESLKKNKSKVPIIPLQTIIEEPVVQKEKKPVVSEVEKVNNPETVENSVPAPVAPKPIRKNLANKGNVWDMIRNSA